MVSGLKLYELVNKFARKLAIRPGKEGIMQIPNNEVIRDLSNKILTKFMKHNIPKATIRSENDVKSIYNQIISRERQRKK